MPTIKLSGETIEIEIFCHRIGWWQYCLDIERTLMYSSKRLRRFLDKRSMIAPGWKTTSHTGEILCSTSVDTHTAYMQLTV